MDLHASVETFLKTYEAAIQAQDAERLAALYADSFVFADPARSTTVRREDFAKALPRRQAFFSQIGLEATALDTVDVQPLSEGYCLANATWRMHFRKDQRQVESENRTSYVLRQLTGGWEIVFQLDHQDLGQRAAELGLLH